MEIKRMMKKVTKMKMTKKVKMKKLMKMLKRKNGRRYSK